MLQSSGKISLGNIQKEFEGDNPIKLSEYYLNGTYVKANINGKIPTSDTNKLSNYYGAASWYLEVKFDLVSESKSKYGNSDNGKIQIWIKGTAKNWTLTCTKKANIKVTAQNEKTVFANLDAGINYTVTLTDNVFDKKWTFEVDVPYDTGSGRVKIGETKIGQNSYKSLSYSSGKNVK